MLHYIKQSKKSNLCALWILMINLLSTPGNFESIPVQPRIVGGRVVSINEYPYHLSLLFKNTHHCGAGLIDKTIAITGAHCVTHPEEFYSIRAGSSVINYGGVIVHIKRIILHPRFNNLTLDYDIAIIILKCCLVFGTAISPIRLPEFHKSPGIGTSAVITGWGVRYPRNVMLSPYLQRVVVPILSQNVCIKCYGIHLITNRMVCAGYLLGGKDSCQCDSGGPLVAVVRNLFFLVYILEYQE